MGPSVKSESVQPASWRQQQAQGTRDRIAEAARHLFAQQGYGATSIEAIAAEAGVATRTVYSAFGAKREILSHICEMWLERARAVETAQAVLQQNDPRALIRLATGWLTQLYAAGFDVVLIFEAATDESLETRELLRAKLAGRDQVMDAMIAALGDELAVPLPEAQAIFRALAAPGLYRELVEQLGWTPDRLADWMSETLRQHLLRAP